MLEACSVAVLVMCDLTRGLLSQLCPVLGQYVVPIAGRLGSSWVFFVVTFSLAVPGLGRLIRVTYTNRQEVIRSGSSKA